MDVRIAFERTRQKQHGDYATNLAMVLAGSARRSPGELASLIVDALPPSGIVSRVEIAGPGFINIFLEEAARYAVLKQVIAERDRFGFARPDSKNQKILLEFVSANPTGPLHVGHGRGAAYGDALGRLMSAAGYTVHREYYVNDAGRQMDILTTSVWLRYLELAGEEIVFPGNAYQGDYIVEMAQQVFDESGSAYILPAEKVNEVREGLDEELALDASIACARTAANEGYEIFFSLALDTILGDIRDDLDGFGVRYDEWFSERSLYSSGEIEQAVDKLRHSGHVYDKDGALWFRSTDFGDEKDRVVVRENGTPTYFAGDIAYHLNKLERGFDHCIDIWGSDHHGYIPRVKAALQALGEDPDRLTVLLVQFAVLYRDGQKVSMSTRGGQFVTLRELRGEVGEDAARFFYVQRKSEQHMDFDLDLARSRSNENPVYYVQYAHARICSVFTKAKERGIDLPDFSEIDETLLNTEHEEALLSLIGRFPEMIQSAASQYEPHQVTYYLRELATAFHAYYNACKFLDAPDQTRDARLGLLQATRQVLRNGVAILGVSAPEKM